MELCYDGKDGVVRDAFPKLDEKALLGKSQEMLGELLFWLQMRISANQELQASRVRLLGSSAVRWRNRRAWKEDLSKQEGEEWENGDWSGRG